MANVKQVLAGISTSGKRNRKLLLSISGCLLLVAAVIGIVAGVHSGHHDRNLDVSTLTPPTHAILKSSCSSTRYPDLCYSAVAAFPGAAAGLATQKDVIEASLNITTVAVEQNFFTVEKLLSKRSKRLTKREKRALHDCLETIDETLDELQQAARDLNSYPSAAKSLKQHADDLKTLMSAAITNQETCLDGFSHEDADRQVREALEKGQVHVEKMCSNALAMIKNMTDADMEAELKTPANRRMLKEEDPVQVRDYSLFRLMFLSLHRNVEDEKKTAPAVPSTDSA